MINRVDWCSIESIGARLRMDEGLGGDWVGRLVFDLAWARACMLRLRLSKTGLVDDSNWWWSMAMVATVGSGDLWFFSDTMMLCKVRLGFRLILMHT